MSKSKATPTKATAPKERTKAQAAKFLKVSIRTLQRYMERKEIAYKTVEHKGVLVTLFDESELKRFRDESAKAKIVKESPAQPANEAMTLSRQTERVMPLSRSGSMPLPVVEFQSVMERIAGALEVSRKPTLEEVQALTVAEAVELSGEPKSRIVKDARAGVLASHGNGRARRIRRGDLIEYLSKL
jgi:predicted site-specific integrase-resolvase